jgi:hypothetical protein
MVPFGDGSWWMHRSPCVPHRVLPGDFEEVLGFSLHPTRIVVFWAVGK